MNCDMCGKEALLVRALIEGVEMTVCKDCAPFGKILSSSQHVCAKKPLFVRPKEPEIIETIVDDYALKIKQAREERKLNQEEFAKMLNEKESVLHKIEGGKQRPPLELAQKLEKILNIQLVEKITVEPEQKAEKAFKGSLTIGDLLERGK